MTFNYAKTRGTAERLIARFGQVGAIRRETPGAGPPYSPGPPTVADHAATLVVLDYENREIDGTRILATDKKVLIAAGGLAIEPGPADKVVIGGAAHEVVDVKPLSPAGVVVLFEAQCRR